MLRRSLPRGFALLMVLGVTAVLVLCTGAFFQINQTSLTALSGGQRRREALLAAHSGIQYCLYKVESDQKWGKDVFQGGQRPLEPSGGGIVVYPKSGTHTVEGTFEGVDRLTFSVTVRNKLSLAGIPASVEPGMPADSLEFQAVGKSGSVEVRCVALYRGEPLYDSSLTAQGNIDLSTSQDISVSSTDKMRNWIRSNGDINFGGLLESNSNQTLQVAKEPDGAKGTIWAKGDVTIREGGDNRHVLRGEQLANVADASGGDLAPRSRLNHEIFPLKPADLKQATGSKGRLPGGTYVVAAARTPDDKLVKVLRVYHDPPVNGVWQTIHCDFDQAVQDNTMLPGDWLGDGVDVVWETDGKVSLGTSDVPGTPAMEYRFADNEFSTLGHAVVEVPTRFEMMSTLDKTPINGKPVENAVLNLGQTDPTVIRAQGSILCEGIVHGKGGLSSDQGDLTLMTQTNISTDDGAGLVLYGRNVTICGSGGTAAAFRGLIYAKQNFLVWGGLETNLVLDRLATGVVQVGVRTKSSNKPLSRLDIEGAVVAQAGNITIWDTEDVNLRYNEKLLNDFTKGLPDDYRRLRLAAMREL